jgi:hypothetical protein
MTILHQLRAPVLPFLRGFTPLGGTILPYTFFHERAKEALAHAVLLCCVRRGSARTVCSIL